MRKKLVKHGNSLALIIDKPILELLGIGEDDGEVEMMTDGSRLIVAQPGPDAERTKKLISELEWVNRVHGKTLKKLAE